MSSLFSTLRAQDPVLENINHEQATSVIESPDSDNQSAPNSNTRSNRKKIDALTLSLKTIIGFAAITTIIGAFFYYKRLLNR